MAHILGTTLYVFVVVESYFILGRDAKGSISCPMGSIQASHTIVGDSYMLVSRCLLIVVQTLVIMSFPGLNPPYMVPNLCHIA